MFWLFSVGQQFPQLRNRNLYKNLEKWAI